MSCRMPFNLCISDAFFMGLGRKTAEANRHSNPIVWRTLVTTVTVTVGVDLDPSWGRICLHCKRPLSPTPFRTVPTARASSSYLDVFSWVTN
jgi:hypothetical protein